MAITLTYPEGGALVTGGTGRVGQGIVRRLAQAGVPLVFTYRGNAEAAHALADELGAAGHEVAACRLDMTDLDTIRAALAQVVERHGRLHTVICGSGVVVRFARLADFSIEDVERFMNADALGYYRIFHEAIPILRASGGGTIIPCSTMATRRVIDYDGLSPFSKGSVDALVRQVAGEEAVHGIRCNAVAIGWVEDRTRAQVIAETGPRPDTPSGEVEQVTALMHQLLDLARMREPVTSTEAGDTFAWLASDQARHLTGADDRTRCGRVAVSGGPRIANRYGPIRQIAYVTHDVPAAMRHFIAMGIGPWYHGDAAVVSGFDYLGSAEQPDLEFAIAPWGGLQLELMRQRGDTPSILRDWMRRPFESLLQHHVAVWPDDYAATLALATGDGYVVQQRAQTVVGRFCYLIHPAMPDFVLEMTEQTPERREYGAHIDASQHDWTDATAIRPFGSR